MSDLIAAAAPPRTRPPPGGCRYRMTLAYDGTDFSGWQVQPDKRTVQGEVETGLQHLAGAVVHLHSCGRTDAGVHARAQVAHFDLAAPWKTPGKIGQALNARLPDSIRVLTVRRTRPGFHARYDAQGKQYRYSIWNAPVACPLHRRQTLHVWRPLDVAAMRQAAALLEGQHDFASFSANPGREISGTVRTLWQLAVRQQGPLLTLAVVGDGFLYKMVRSLAGHLIRVGLGAVAADETHAILAARVRTARVETAPPHGLCLWTIYYGALPATVHKSLPKA
ncbi:MAG: tRNA pseudouridine(38-40) synthase TruA [Kiritimatiellae bacterium]|nr:tRNA pseudouridine(38-40) synthase TruA [Kiritimatiellia bacterium]MDD4342195.1 tRNA pseudouridine(38-40) synthase TruA [Kiritimatiellia bacterium]